MSKLNLRFRTPRVPRRQGMVSLEYLAFLPLFLILFVCLLTLTSAALTRIDVEMAARNATWSQRHDPHPKFQTRGSIRYPQPMMDLARGSKTRPGTLIGVDVTRHGDSLVDEIQIVANQTNWLVGGSWDHRQIQFEKESSRRRLVPDRLLGRFTGLPLRDWTFMNGIWRGGFGRFKVLDWRGLDAINTVIKWLD